MKEVIRLEKALADHKSVPATNAFTEISWSQKQGDLIREYKMALARAGYKTLEERKKELEDKEAWARVFKKFPVEEMPSRHMPK